MKWNEDLNAQSDRVLVYGLIVALDLDRFEEYVEARGLDPYVPNIVTGELTNLVEEFARKHQGVIIYGLSRERGTEEAIIEIPLGHLNIENILVDLQEIRQRILELGASISIIVIADYVSGKPARDRREAYKGTIGRKRAVKLLREVKSRGGGGIRVVV
ncbi:MAG: hypothetical protein QXE81_02650 [Desulfurococcaceae archaeon]